MKPQKDYKYNGPDVPKKQKKSYTDHVSKDNIKVSEASSIKMMYLSGATISEISRAYKRSHGAVKNVIDSFDSYLPQDKTLKDAIYKQIEQISDEILKRSKAIVDKADKITYERLDNENVSPLEASKISETHLNRFAQIIGENRLKSMNQNSSNNNVQINIMNPEPQQEDDKNKNN